MDTDDLTEMAWDIIVSASRVSDTLKAGLGALASRFRTEEEWLRGVRAHWGGSSKTLPSMSTLGTLKTQKLLRKP